MQIKLLVADDEEGIRELLQAIVGSDERYRVFMASDGEDALQVARSVKPDIVLLDLWMPKKTGFEVCQELKRDPETARIGVIMLTDLLQGSVRRRALRSGADGYISKPFSQKELLEKLTEVSRRLLGHGAP